MNEFMKLFLGNYLMVGLKGKWGWVLRVWGETIDGNLLRRGDVTMKIIKMELGGKEVAEIVDGQFHCIMENRHPFALNFVNLYDACFYGIHHSSTFEERFEHVKNGNYFCYLKPTLKLIAKER